MSDQTEHHKKIKKIIEHNSMQSHLDRLKSESDQPPPNKTDYMSLVEAHMKEEKCTKAQAMRAISAKHPEAHELWLDSVQKS